MKLTEFSISGKIDDKGNLLLGYKGDLLKFLAQNKSSNVIISYLIQDEKASIQFRGLYWNKIMPLVNDGLKELGNRFTLEQADNAIRELSPVCKISKFNQQSGSLENVILKIEDLSTSQLLQHIEFVREFAMEHLNINID